MGCKEYWRSHRNAESIINKSIDYTFNPRVAERCSVRVRRAFKVAPPDPTPYLFEFIEFECGHFGVGSSTIKISVVGEQ